MVRVITVLMSLLAFFPVRASLACGVASDCLVSEGSYRIMLPSNPSGRSLGAVVYLHGWQQSAEDVMNEKSLVATAQRLGVALVAPNGEGKTWSFPSAPFHYRDDFAFIQTVIDDIVRRYSIDRKHLLGAGFSQGASMIWYLACQQPRLFAAFAPVSGAFWLPAPNQCTAPLPVLLHLHGLADTTVPMEGREIAPGIRQDGVRESFAILGDSATLRPSAAVHLNSTIGVHLTCQRSDRQPDGGMVELCLHHGGHLFMTGWIEHAWRVLGE